MAQFAIAADPARSLELARQFVLGKMKNCRTMLRRHLSDGASELLTQMTELGWAAWWPVRPSPPVAATRLKLPKQYGLRLYPDLTHNKICQFQVPGWDQAYALTLGREAVNPRPAEMAIIHNWFAPYSDGFISYSDGAHDDVNKVIFSAPLLESVGQGSRHPRRLRPAALRRRSG